MICPECGHKMKHRYEYRGEYVFEDCSELYYKKVEVFRCPQCKIKYDGEYHIPKKLQPTEKQKRTVKFIENRLGRHVDFPELRSYYSVFIFKWFDEAKQALPKQTYLSDEDMCSYFDESDFC